MQRLEVSGAVWPIYGSLGVKRLCIHVEMYCNLGCLLSRYCAQIRERFNLNFWWHKITVTEIQTDCYFDILLTVNLYIYLNINQLDALNFIMSLLHASTWVLSRPVHGTAAYSCDDTRDCIVQFWPPDDENIVLETCRGMK